MEQQTARIRFLAQNKYLLIETVEEENKENSSVVLPEGYKKKENPFKLGQLLDVEKNSPFFEFIGSYIVFPSNALEEISLHGMEIKMVPSHSVYGVLKNEQ